MSWAELDEADCPKAAQYLRMSTDHQRYSLANQAAAIARYASDRGYQVVRTYSDAGISGLRLKHRLGLQQLLADVVAGDRSFDRILVYDLSRWGRFQNPDQSAHYEFICAEAGVRVEYCAELFENDGSITSSLVKGLKRVMAAEFSRELSAKVAAAKIRGAERGSWQGSSPGYGLRRRVIDEHGRPGVILQSGQRKIVHGQDVVLVPGPKEEVAIVRRIFHQFVDDRMSCVAIARALNADGVPAPGRDGWKHAYIGSVLRNPKYVGDLLYNCSMGYLGGPRATRPQSEWVLHRKAFRGIVDRKTFEAAQARWRARRPTNEDVLDHLRGLLATHGKLTVGLITEAPGDHLQIGAIARRFGSLQRAYEAAGYVCKGRQKVHMATDEMLRGLSRLAIREGRLTRELIASDPALPSWGAVAGRLGTIRQIRAQLGIVPLTRKDLASPVGMARATAMAQRLAKLAD